MLRKSRISRRGLLKSAGVTAAVAVAAPVATAQQPPELPLFLPRSADFPFEKKRVTINGSSMAYVDQGEGRPVVFLHGNPTSSYLWRNIMPYVADTHRIIAPDMIGMGDSDKPDIAYRYFDHADYLHQLLDKLDLKDAVFVIHDWGSALGIHYMRENSARVSAFAFMESTVPPLFPFSGVGRRADFLLSLRAEDISEEMLQNNARIEVFLRTGGVIRPIDDAAMAVYRAPYPTPQSRRLTLQWVREIPIGGDPADVFEIAEANNAWLVESDLPKLLFYADPGGIITPESAKWLIANLKNIETRFLGVGRHFLQEDHPHLIGSGLADWLRRL